MTALLEARDVTVRFGGLSRSTRSACRSPERLDRRPPRPERRGQDDVLRRAVRACSGPRPGTVLDRRRRHDHARRPQRRARRGLARTFQRLELFPELTVREHLVVAYRSGHRNVACDCCSTRSGSAGGRRRARTMRSTRSSTQLGLTRLASAPAARSRSGPAGSSRSAGPSPPSRGAAARRTVLGLDATETAGAGRGAARGPRDDRGISIVLVEHNVEMVLGAGRPRHRARLRKVIAEGTPAEIRASAAVQAAYLGTRRTTRDRRASPLLEVERLEVAYGGARALFGVALAVRARPGASRCSARTARARARSPRRSPAWSRRSGGRIILDGDDVTRWPAHRRRPGRCRLRARGARHLPPPHRDRQPARMLRAAVPAAERADAARTAPFETFPVLQRAPPSGGRARCPAASSRCSRWRACSRRRRGCSIADEMSLGLAPRMVDVVFDGLAPRPRARASRSCSSSSTSSGRSPSPTTPSCCARARSPGRARPTGALAEVRSGYLGS